MDSSKTATTAPVHGVVMPYLIDRGDGVRGHFCIGRCANGVYSEFWNDGHGWCSAGTVYVGREAAEAKLKEVA